MTDKARKFAGSILLAIVSSCGGTTDPNHPGPATGYYQLSATGLDATGRTVVAFNKRGDIALHDGTNAYRFRDGTLTQLTGVPGAAITRAIGMNENGIVIGRSGSSPVRWAVASEMPAQPPISTTRFLTDINNAGDAIFETGYYSSSAGRDTAFIVWTSQGTLETISTMQMSLSGGGGSLYATSMNDAREILISILQLHSSVTLLSPLARPSSNGGNCPFSTQSEAVALNDSGVYIRTAGLTQCLVRPGKPEASLLIFATSRPRFNNNSWMAGDANSDGSPVLATHPDTVVPAHELFESAADRDGWTIEKFVALNDNNQVLAIATKGTRREFIVLAPR
jgi:hypothetical protein